MTFSLARGAIRYGPGAAFWNANAGRRFHLARHQDVSGVSGTGTVAEGMVFSDGTVAMRWLTDTATSVFFDSIQDVEAIHGHDGNTEVVYDD